MDATEAEYDIKLQKISADLIGDVDRALAVCLRESDGHGGTKIRSWVRTFQTIKSTATVLDMFQELPQLLDPHLPKWIPLLADSYLEYLQTRHKDRRDPNVAHLVSSLDQIIGKILYAFCKVRGEKVIVRFFSAETRHLELLLSAIEESEKPKTGDGAPDPWCWEQRYVVLLWLSHLMLAPFDLSTISSVDLDGDNLVAIPGMKWPANLPGITMRIIPLAIRHLASAGKERDAAKALLVRTAMRRDMQSLGVLECLVQWALTALRPKKDGTLGTTHFYLGVLSLLAGMLRSSSETSDMDRYLPAIFQTVHAISTSDNDLSKLIDSLALARKMMLKVIRSVIVSLLRQTPQTTETTELAETAIEYLLESLSDNDTPVRLAASKSLSIITLKLDPEMAAQVVEAVLESLNRNVLWTKVSKGSSAKPVRDLSAVNSLEWHGLILTLSHLLYRRSPPARQLSDIVHALLLGLSFEQRGVSGTSVGANVRDAACFGIWALARRYSTEELLAVPMRSIFSTKLHPESGSIIQVLGTELVVTASLDPAGNIRRGASAALQELIGRHPDMVERGIEVVQTVDYHAVARRARAIGTVAIGATKLSSQYGEAIMDGILGWRGVGDLDTPSRRVAGAAFGVITRELSNTDSEDQGLLQLESSVKHIEERLDALRTRQVEERHGLLTCFAGVLDQIPQLVRLNSDVDMSLLRQIIANASHILEDCHTTTYRKPEIIAEAASRLVVSLLPVLQLVSLPDALRGDLVAGEELLASSKARGYLEVVSMFDSVDNESKEMATFTSKLEVVIPDWLNGKELETIELASAAALVLLIVSKTGNRLKILQSWADLVQSKSASQMGTISHGYFFALALAQPLAAQAMPNGPQLDVATAALLRRWSIDQDVEIRVAILRSLLQTRVLQANPLPFLDLLAEGLNDYTNVARGDIGSFVRFQSLRAVTTLWEDGQFSENWMQVSLRQLIYSVVRLSAEKLDRVRPQAQVALASLLLESHSQSFSGLGNSSQPYFLFLLNLCSADYFNDSVGQIIKEDVGAWMSALLAGFVTSADTGNDTLIVASRAALAAFCEVSPANLTLVCEALVHNLRVHQGEDRIVVPTLEIIAFLFNVGLFQQCKSINLRNLCLQTQKSSYKSGHTRKIQACAKVYGGIAGMGEDTDVSSVEARKRLGALLLHPWSRVRNAVVDELWGLVGDAEAGDGDVLLSVDWAQADKSKIKAAAAQLKLL